MRGSAAGGKASIKKGWLALTASILSTPAGVKPPFAEASDDVGAMRTRLPLIATGALSARACSPCTTRLVPETGASIPGAEIGCALRPTGQRQIRPGQELALRKDGDHARHIDIGLSNRVDGLHAGKTRQNRCRAHQQLCGLGGERVEGRIRSLAAGYLEKRDYARIDSTSHCSWSGVGLERCGWIQARIRVVETDGLVSG